MLSMVSSRAPSEALEVTLFAAPLSLFNTLDVILQGIGSWLECNIRLNCF